MPSILLGFENNSQLENKVVLGIGVEIRSRDELGQPFVPTFVLLLEALLKLVRADEESYVLSVWELN